MKYKEVLELAINESEEKIKATNLWIKASNDEKQVEKMRKDNGNEKKQIAGLEKRLESMFKKNVDHESEDNPPNAKALKFLGNISTMNMADSEKIIAVYQERAREARKNALERNKEEWLKSAEQWDKVVEITNKIILSSNEATQYLFLAAEMIKPEIVVGRDKEGRRKIDELKIQVLSELNDDGSF